VKLAASMNTAAKMASRHRVVFISDIPLNVRGKERAA